MHENKFSFDFDTRNNKELNPHLFFSDLSLYTYTSSFYTKYLINFLPADFEKKTYSNFDEYLQNKENMKKYQKDIIFRLKKSITQESYNFPFIIKNKYSCLNDILISQQKALFSFISFLISRIEKKLKHPPMPRIYLPNYDLKNKKSNDVSDKKLLKNIEDEIKSILGQIDKNFSNDANKNTPDYLFLQNSLVEINDVLNNNYPKTFSLSPNSNMINLALKKFDEILNDYYYSQNYVFIYGNMKSKCYILILLLKMRFYMIANQMLNFLAILIQLLNIQHEHPQVQKDPFFSLEESVQEIPNCSTTRSIIMTDIEYDQILDFCLSNDESNDFILTKKGIFQIVSTKRKNHNNIIKYSELKLIGSVDQSKSSNFIYRNELQKVSSKNEAKIAFSNGILYLLILKEKVVYKFRVSNDEEMVQNRRKILQKIKKTKEYSKQPKHKKVKAKLNQNSSKKIREKMKNEKKKIRKFEKFKDEYEEINLDKIKVDLSDIPILAIGSYNNYLRIVQQISYDNEKLYKLSFTNVDMMPKSRINFDIEKVFNEKEVNDEYVQTNHEIVIKTENKINNILFSGDYMFVCFDNSTINHYMIYNNGNVELIKKMVSPLISLSNTVLKIDNKMYLYYLEPINKNDEHSALVVSKMFLPETKHWLREENSLFLKYPFLIKLSSIVNNCSQFILNCNVDTSFTLEENLSQKPNKKSMKMKIIPDEMNSVIQSPYMIISQLPNIKDIINNIKDENLAKFAVVILIRLIGIDLFYSTKLFIDGDKIGEKEINMFKSCKDFILDLYSSLYHSNSVEFDLILDESILFVVSICGKYLFYPNSFSELRILMNQILCNDHNFYSKYLLKSFSSILFSYPSSLYFIDQTIYQQIIKFENEINVHELFMQNIIFILLEIKFSHSIKNTEFIDFITPYINALFIHIKYIINNESIPFNTVKQILSYLFGYDMSNISFSLTIQKELIEICSDLYKRIHKCNDVIEHEKQFLELKNDIEKQEVQKEIKTIERIHPLCCDNNKSIKITKTIEFNASTDAILIEFDNSYQYFKNDEIILYPKYYENPIHLGGKENIKFNSIYKLKTNFIKVEILINNNYKNKIMQNLGGYKITFTGIESKNPVFWIPHPNINFYDYFISFLVRVHCHLYESIKFDKSEDEFNSLLKDKIIQGIKLEANNSLNLDYISNGIEYDYKREINYDNDAKKKALFDILAINGDLLTSVKKCINVIYDKTSKLNRINLNNSTKSILENEHFFIACLLKHLGLISDFINFVEFVDKNCDQNANIEIPDFIKLIWKYVYKLRKELFYIYQKSKNTTNSQSNSTDFNYVKILEEMKNKCILLLYSQPILMLKEKGELINDLIDETALKLYLFITSKINTSEITQFIENREKRLLISSKSLSYFLSFVDQNNLFETSKYVLINFYNCVSPFSKCKGLSRKELNDYADLSSKLSVNLHKKILSNVKIEQKYYALFLVNLLLNNEYDDSKIQYSKILFGLIEKNNQMNFILIQIILCVSIKTKSDDLIDSILLLLSKNEIDLCCKQLILSKIPLLMKCNPDNNQLLDENFVFSIMDENKQNPIIVKTIFYWIAFISLKRPKVFNHDFILNILKGIGQSFTGKSCLFIDDSFEPYVHRQVSKSMISFIRILFNHNHNDLFLTIHDTLQKSIKKVDFGYDSLNNDVIYILIGLFSSIGQTLSSFEPNCRMAYDSNKNSDISISNYNPSLKQIHDNNEINRSINGSFTNFVAIDPMKLNLNGEEIQNLFILHKAFIHSNYFKYDQKYNKKISQKEIEESILITTFYSFLPIIFQNKNNIKILFTKCNIKDTLLLLELSRYKIPSNENSILLLSHYLEQAIFSPQFDSFRFIRLNFGEIIYEKSEYDIIKSNADYFNIFISNRPFNFQKETYFSLKVKKIGSKNIFIGIIDSEEMNYNKAFGFGYLGDNSLFCRKSPYLSNDTIAISDKCLNHEININEGDLIGCFYTQDFLYFTLNGVLTKYRLSHKSLNTYLPVVYVDHDDVEFEVTQNIIIIDHSVKKYDFLNINNYNDEYFKEKDIVFSIQNKDEFSNNNNSSIDTIEQKPLLIGQLVKIDQMNSIEFNIETTNLQTQNLFDFKNNFGIIKDIVPLCNKYVSKIKIESFNNNKLSREITDFDIDSRFISCQETNFFNLIENSTNNKFGFNSSFDLNYLPENLQNTSDSNEIKAYLQNKTIKDNSKSIAIIMTRYLVFIIVDYLRYSKSIFLQDCGINTEESKSIIKSLVYSLPTITMFNPEFDCSIDDNSINDYLVFKDDQKNKNNKILVLSSSCFHYSFIGFLKKAENFISRQFFTYLLQNLFEVTAQNDLTSISYLYELIPSNHKIESLFPLPEQFNYKIMIEKPKLTNDANKNDIVGFIPILVSSIPNQLPCAICEDKRFRKSSNEISYFSHFDVNQNISLKWKYNIKKLSVLNLEDFNDYKLQFGIFTLSDNLQEILLNSQLGFIQIIFIFIQILINSINHNKKHHDLIPLILEKMIILSQKKNALASPFLKEIIAFFISQNEFIDLLLRESSSSQLFTNLSGKDIYYEINDFLDIQNESQIILNLFSNLIKTKKVELSISNQKNKEELSLLFEEYYEAYEKLFNIFNINNKINIDFIENTFKKLNKKQKNSISNSFYSKKLFDLIYYYSVLLRNNKNIPYPMFVFVHEYIRQHFGGFCLTIDQNDIDSNTNSNQLIIYQTDMIKNDFDLECTFNIINVYGNRQNKEKCEILIHYDNEDDDRLNVLQVNKKVVVSFPIEISVINKSSQNRDLQDGNVFVINFEPSKEQQKNYFITHYSEIQKAFQQFISLEKYENRFISLIEINDENDDYFNSNNDERNDENDDISSLNLNAFFQQNENEIDYSNDIFIDVNNDDNNDENDINNFNVLVNEFENDYDNIIQNNHPNDNVNIYFNRLLDFFPSISVLRRHPFYWTDHIIHSRKPSIFNIFQKIPEISLEHDDIKVDQLIISLRYSILSSYIIIFETFIKNSRNLKKDEKNSIWDFHYQTKKNSLLTAQIISPLYSLSTEYKFKFIQNIILSNKSERSNIKLTINRFEQQKFMELIENKDEFLITERPFLFQFMQQVNEKSLSKLKSNKNRPFFVTLVGENAIDEGGPAREIFSSLWTEMMNKHVGVFAFNPNRQHNCKEKNQEDLIPFSNSCCYNESYSDLFSKRFVYTGALIAACAVSGLPQPIKLASFIWEYLIYEKVTIENIYEIDENFKKFIENAENIQNMINSSDLNKDEFESFFMHAFDINDSFDNIIELIPSGSKILVTIENLKDFIQLSKNFRIHEFDDQLKELKRGFDIVMCNKNITSILNPKELKLLICGEPSCDVAQMKELIEISVDTNCDSEKITKMFWNVIESFSVDERMNFIRFSSGNLGLPAPGLKWNKNIKVKIENSSRNKKLATASTCSSVITIPSFESEEELARILRVSIENSGVITDSIENLEMVSNFL